MALAFAAPQSAAAVLPRRVALGPKVAGVGPRVFATLVLWKPVHPVFGLLGQGSSACSYTTRARAALALAALPALPRGRARRCVPEGRGTAIRHLFLCLMSYCSIEERDSSFDIP